MTEFHWTEYLTGDVQEAVELLENYWIHTKIEKKGASYIVWGGDQPIITCESEKEAKAFVLGMALGYETLADELKPLVKRSLAP